MGNKQITLKVTLEFDEKWASNFTREELLEYLKEKLNYGLGFPKLYDTFFLTQQGDRQANILGFRGVKEISSVIPLIKIRIGSLRVDLRTSAWILGRLLKTLSFAHDIRFEVGRLSDGNILLEPDDHCALIFDWSRAVLHDEAVPASVRRQEIQAVTQAVVQALGGDLDRAQENEADVLYTNYLRLLATDGMSDASEAHQTLYEIIDRLCEDSDSVWEKGFYQFTTCRRI